MRILHWNQFNNSLQRSFFINKNFYLFHKWFLYKWSFLKILYEEDKTFLLLNNRFSFVNFYQKMIKSCWFLLEKEVFSDKYNLIQLDTVWSEYSFLFILKKSCSADFHHFSWTNFFYTWILITLEHIESNHWNELLTEKNNKRILTINSLLVLIYIYKYIKTFNQLSLLIDNS